MKVTCIPDSLIPNKQATASLRNHFAPDQGYDSKGKRRKVGSAVINNEDGEQTHQASLASHANATAHAESRNVLSDVDDIAIPVDIARLGAD